MPDPAPDTRSFLAELMERRVYRVAAMYVVVAYAVLEASDLLLPALDAPDWIFQLLVGGAFLGFPVALALAWYFDLTPEGVEATDSRILHGGPAALWIRRGLVGVVAVSALVLGIFALRRGLPEPTLLDPDRIVVFPLAAPREGGLAASVGEDIATMIGHALDRAGSLRWIDAWPFMTEAQQAAPRGMTVPEARALAARRGSAHFVLGRVVPRGDSVTVLLDLFHADEEIPVRRASADGAAADPWRLGLQAANQLLPALIDAPPADFGDRFIRRDPAAVALFLTGESAFRRSRHAEALEAYQAAFAADPLFAEAALRGAQAASWEHRDAEAALLIEGALALPLGPRDRAFARGMQAYQAGDSEGALTGLERALALDPGMAAAHAQLGEVYHHLAPSRRRPDSVATAAFERAWALDPTLSGVLYHLAQHRIRSPSDEGLDALAETFRNASSDASLVAEIDLSARCAVEGPGAVEWVEAAHRHPGPLLEAAVNLGAGETRWPCAEAAYRALLAHDTVTTGWEIGRRWSGLKGLHVLLMATGRTADGLTLLDSARVSLAALRRVADPAGTDLHRSSPAEAAPIQFAEYLFLLDEAAGYDTGGRAVRVAAADRGPSGGYETNNTFRLWFLGAWEASRGEVARVRAVAERMEARLARGGATPRDSLLTRAMAGHRALAEADTARALEIFRGLRPRGSVQWHAADALGLERLVHARLALARGEAREARDVATYLEATPSIYPLFLPEALRVRAAAMERADRDTEAREIRSRADRLQDGPQ